MANIKYRSEGLKFFSWLSEEALQIAVKRREAKSTREKKIYLFECGVPKNSKER